MSQRASYAQLGLFAVCVALVSTRAHAEDAPLAMAEARIAQGVAVGGGSGESTWRWSPLTLSVLASMAIQTQPYVSVYGGVLFEGNNRAALGATIGFRLNPQAGHTRVGVGATMIGLPFTAYGVTAGVGRCLGVSGGMGVCTDLEATVFAFGSDVPQGRVATQVQAVLGVAFDVY